MTVIDRRSFLAALSVAVGGAFAPRRAVAGLSQPLFVSACMGKDNAASVAVFSLDGHILFQTSLPERGHDIALRPYAADIVVFARRPGDWAAVIHRESGQTLRVFTAPQGRHFYGHGVFSADGVLLYATENNIATGEGVIGIYDAQADYHRIGEMPSFGIGPHDLAFLPGRPHLVIANGGIRTHPQTGREILNKNDMQPSLAIVDAMSEKVLVSVDLGADLKGLSIRHLAVSAGGETVFGCQYTGDIDEMPALVGTMRPDGTIRFLPMPEDDLAAINNYVGSVTLDATGRIAAATSPTGNTIALWDLAAGRYLGRRRMSDVCGIAPTSLGGVFLATSGNSGVRLAQVQAADLRSLGGTELDRWIWDNHTRSL